MGLSTGEAELRGADYFGAVLDRAARVMAAGHGGQILLAEPTASLVRGVDLVELGPRRLRDLPTPVPLFQVRAPACGRSFRRCGRWMRGRGICVLRPRAHRTRVRDRRVARGCERLIDWSR